MFTKNRELAGFALHRSVPHVWGIHWDNEVDAIVLLENCELCCVYWIRARKRRV